MVGSSALTATVNATSQPGVVQAALPAAGSAYTGLAPARLLDTRTSGQTLTPNSSLNLTVTGGSVPMIATAVALNVTVTGTTAVSFLTVYPAGGTLPLVSNLNWSPGETVPNLVIVPVGSGGQITFYNDQGSADLVVDLEGYFAPEPSGTTAGSYVPLTPSRITDTRPGSGEPNAGKTMGPGSSLNIQVTGAGGVPSSGVAAALLNVTVTDTTTPSFLTVYPQDTTMSTASNLNWTTGDTVANRVVAPVTASGQISVYNDFGNADVLVDVSGYFTDGSSSPSNASLYDPMSPIRVLDTRTDAGTSGANSYLSEQFAGIDGISSTANAILANLTSTNASEPGYFSVVPEQATPTTSDVNFGASETVPNLVIATLDSQGDASIYNLQGTADAIVDVFGYFEPEATLGEAAVAPCTAVSLTANVSTITQGTPVTATASATCLGGATVSYEYWFQAPNTSAWTLAQGSTSAGTFAYDTSNWIAGWIAGDYQWVAGDYQLVVWASSQSGVYQGVQASFSVNVSAPITTTYGIGKVIVVDLATQSLTAYDSGQVVLAAPVTTGMPGLRTPTGTFSIHWKATPYLFISPWPKGSPYYYSPEWATWVMNFLSGGFDIHDAPWEPASAFGPGSENGPYASHGCVHVPYIAMQFLFAWSPDGTTVVIAS
jgi:lipoprotein-anchoring transpeptidase ErfK/SrfK